MFPVRQPWLCKALGAFLYPISANAFINTADVCYLLQQHALHWKKCMRLSWSHWWLLLFGRFTWSRCLNSCLSLLPFFFVAFLPVAAVLVCAYGFADRASFFIAPRQRKRVPHRGVDVLCGYMCGLCRLCADILCPLRLLWLLYPVHWGSALPIPGGHLAVLCWHGIILWLWARSVDPNWSPGGDILRPQCSGLCDHGLLVSDFLLNSLTCGFVDFGIWPDFTVWLSQHQILPVRDLWPGIIFLPLWYPVAGWGFLHHERRQADLWWIQEHPVWPLPQPHGETRVEGGGLLKKEGKYDVRSLLGFWLLVHFSCDVKWNTLVSVISPENHELWQIANLMTAHLSQ